MFAHFSQFLGSSKAVTQGVGLTFLLWYAHLHKRCNLSLPRGCHSSA